MVLSACPLSRSSKAKHTMDTLRFFPQNVQILGTGKMHTDFVLSPSDRAKGMLRCLREPDFRESLVMSILSNELDDHGGRLIPKEMCSERSADSNDSNDSNNGTQRPRSSCRHRKPPTTNDDTLSNKSFWRPLAHCSEDVLTFQLTIAYIFSPYLAWGIAQVQYQSMRSGCCVCDKALTLWTLLHDSWYLGRIYCMGCLHTGTSVSTSMLLLPPSHTLVLKIGIHCLM